MAPQPEGKVLNFQGSGRFSRCVRNHCVKSSLRSQISIFLPGDCPCGTLLKTLERVRGRISGGVEIGAAGCLMMADLDEALFPIAGLLDFSATLTREGSRDHLHIQAIVSKGTGSTTASAIRRQLDIVPSIRSAQEAGRLDVCVDMQSADWRNTPGYRLSKRRIVDQTSL